MTSLVFDYSDGNILTGPFQFGFEFVHKDFLFIFFLPVVALY